MLLCLLLRAQTKASKVASLSFSIHSMSSDSVMEAEAMKRLFAKRTAAPGSNEAQRNAGLVVRPEASGEVLQLPKQPSYRESGLRA